MKITPELKEAIAKAIAHYGNTTQFAKAMGLAHSTVLFWVSGKTEEISGKVWAQKLRPALAPWLPQEARTGFDASNELAAPMSTGLAIEMLIREIARDEIRRARRAEA